MSEGNRSKTKRLQQGVASRSRIAELGLDRPAITPMPPRLREAQPAPSRIADLGLDRPRLTPMPEILRSPPHVAGSTTGRREVAVRRQQKQSAYVSPLAAREERRGILVELREHLRAVLDAVLRGDTLLEAVADGTLWGWRSREALSHEAGEPLANWDRNPGRTLNERLALLERTLGALGESEEKPRRGGWSVTRGGGK